jgi:LmbE family N-acetylglucosaminyl deacetylase
MKNVLVIATHPDDETLGCGGTLLKHKRQGDRIFWLIVTAATCEAGFSQRLVMGRQKTITTISELYGFDGVYDLRLPSTKVDIIPKHELVENFSGVIREIEPHTVYLPFFGDVHSDHKLVFEAAYSCTKSFRYPFVRKIMMMEVVSETEFGCPLQKESFIPNVFVDTSDFHQQKMEILANYASEIGEHPFPRSVENISALATFRGSMAGCKYAEGFMLLKEIAE